MAQLAMACPQCGHRASGVNDSRPTVRGVGMIRRRRKCFRCEEVFTTYEIRKDIFERIRGLDVDKLRDFVKILETGAAAIEEIAGDDG